MTTHTAVVIDASLDVGKGILHCFLESNELKSTPGLVDEYITLTPVIYTTPYSSQGQGGMIAIPAPGTRILIQKVNGKFYYISSILGGDPEEAERIDVASSDIRALMDDKFSAESAGHKIYGTDGEPNTILIKHPTGSRLMFKEDRPENPDDGYTSRTELRSGRKKKLVLDDSPATNCIQLGIDRGMGKDTLDGITIGHNTAGVVGPRCVKIEAEGNIYNVCHSGGMKTWISEGKNWTVENNSMGIMRDPLDPINYGNVSLGSQYGDINLQAGEIGQEVVREAFGVIDPITGLIRQSKIDLFQGTPGGTIQIDSLGNIKIIARGGNSPLVPTIEIEATVGDINLKSLAGSINMFATGGINMTAGGMCAIDAAGTIQLNSGLSNAPGTPTIPEFRGYIPFNFLPGTNL